MKKIFKGYIFTNSHTNNKTVFEHTETGIVRYYPCRMKISDGYYQVKLNKKGEVNWCRRYKKKPLKKLDVEADFKKLEKLFGSDK